MAQENSGSKNARRASGRGGHVGGVRWTRHRWSILALGVIGGLTGLEACGSNGASKFNPGGNGNGSSTTNAFGSGLSTSSGIGGNGNPDGGFTGPFPSKTGTCNSTSNYCICGDGSMSTTSIKGKVYDPAGVNPVFNASVYAIDPSATLPDLDTIPIACVCSQLFPATVNAYATTDGTGSFQMACPPTGMQSIVVQVG